MNIYKEFVIPREKVGEVFKLIGDVVHFNKCYYFVSAVDCDEMKIHKEFMNVKVHFSPYEFDANVEPKEFPKLEEKV